MRVVEEPRALTERTGGVLEEPPGNRLVRVIEPHDAIPPPIRGFGTCGDLRRSHNFVHPGIMLSHVLFFEGVRRTVIKRGVKGDLIPRSYENFVRAGVISSKGKTPPLEGGRPGHSLSRARGGMILAECRAHSA